LRAAEQFFNFYDHDFVRVVAVAPRVHVADPRFNAEQTIQLIEAAVRAQSILALFLNWVCRPTLVMISFIRKPFSMAVSMA
jgi:hypothetical protein